MLVAALYLVAPHAADHAARSVVKTVFERADFILSDARRPPGDEATWQTVALPDQWRKRMPDGVRGQSWYRIKFHLAQDPTSVHALGISHPRASRTTFFVNGTVVGGAGDLIAGRRGDRGGAPLTFLTPLQVTVPPSLMHAGENVIHVRVDAISSATLMHGLPKVTLGEARHMRNDYMVGTAMGFGAQRTFFAMALVSGIISLFLWLARRDDKVMFWYSMACLVWGLVSIPRLGLRWVDFFVPVIPALSWFLNYALVVPLVILCLRTVDLKWPRFEATLWIYLAIEVTAPFWATGNSAQWRLAWDAVNTALLIGGVSILVLRAERPMRWPVIVQIAALVVMATLMSVELMRYLGWVYIDLKAVRHYHVPLMLLAMGAVILERHVLAVRKTEQVNLELDRRVAEKVREIESNYARVEEARREQALARERQRILSDMYDGLGASLIGLLRQARTGGTNGDGIALRVQEALQELRVAVDALQSNDRDLVSVLASLRSRLEGMIRPTGIAFEWRLGELPPIVGLSPSNVFALQRILLETITNALKHSSARRIRFSAQAHGNSSILIEIEDDGTGFDPVPPATGLGLTSMRARAARIGAILRIRSRPGSGTTVALELPASLASAEDTSGHEAFKTGAPQGDAAGAGLAT